MTDVGKVISGLEHCTMQGLSDAEDVCKDCPYYENWTRLVCWIKLLDDARTSIIDLSGYTKPKDHKPAKFQRCDCGKLIVRRGDAHNCPYCGRELNWGA